jgi:16S rRNA (cytosine967-C5)-methyltransferase
MIKLLSGKQDIGRVAENAKRIVACPDRVVRTAMNSSSPAGLASRALAVDVITETIRASLPLDDVIAARSNAYQLEPRDEALSRAIIVTTFRRLGTLRLLFKRLIRRGLPSEAALFPVLAVGAAQILFLNVPDRAAVDLSVELAKKDRRLEGLTGLVNAVLRRIAAEKETLLRQVHPLRDNTPEWLRESWVKAYGTHIAEAIAAAHGEEPSLDVTIRSNPEDWARRLNATLLSTGTLRLSSREAVHLLPGYEEGEWWVQDVSAALPARLLKTGPNERAIDLCAAPGGKTAQLCITGATVVAVERSAKRLARLRDNLDRLHLKAELRAIDALTLPCSSTGTLRRHPDVAWIKTPQDVNKLAALQMKLLDKAASLTKKGGKLVYCTCSLEAEEGEEQIEAFLMRRPDFERLPVQPEELGGHEEWINASGEVRTLPFYEIKGSGETLRGMDGFFAARLVKTS